MGPFGRPLDNLQLACKDIGITEKRLHEDVAVVKEWLRQQPHLPNVESGLLVENLLLRNKGSVELTKQTLEIFFTNRTSCPELFTDQDPCSVEFESIYEERKIFFLNELTSTGHRVAMGDLPESAARLNQTHMQATLKQMIMLMDLTTDKDIACGVIYILDASNMCVALSTMLLKEFALFQKAIRCIFTGYKCRVNGIHLYRPPPAIDYFLGMVKRVLPKKIAGRMHLHPDLASLHQHLEKDILPADYGGKQKPFLELAAEWRQEEMGYRQWFLDRAKVWNTDESKRPAGCFVSSPVDESFGISGSFKKLEFD